VKRTGFITALASEARTLRPAFGRGACTSMAHGVLIAVAGIGAPAAGRAAAAVMKAGARALVSWGYAGGLAPNLTSGTLVVPDRILCTDGSVFDTDEGWREALLARIAGQHSVRRGTLLSSPLILADEECKSRHFRASGAIAVDMESAAVARVAQAWNVPFLAVRAVLDTWGEQVPRALADAIDREGKLRWVQLWRDVARSPRTLHQLLGLRSNYREARQALIVAAMVGMPHVHPSGSAVAM
jgi:adenosylhomocysteine nucleosidase